MAQPVSSIYGTEGTSPGMAAPPPAYNPNAPQAQPVPMQPQYQQQVPMQQQIPQQQYQQQGVPIQQQVQYQQQPQQVVVVQQQAVPMTNARIARRPCILFCPMCKKNVQTSCRFCTSTGTWVIVGGLCIVGCVPCCLIPFCMNSLKKAQHFCTVCQAFIAEKDCI